MDHEIASMSNFFEVDPQNLCFSKENLSKTYLGADGASSQK